MFITESVDIVVGQRNMPILIGIVQSPIKIGQIVTVSSEFFHILSLKNVSVEISCDCCGHHHHRVLHDLKKIASSAGHDCRQCRNKIGIEKMKSAMSKDEMRLRLSQGTIAYNKTDAGKERKKRMVEAQKRWFLTDDGVEFIKKKSEQLRPKCGESHYRFNPNKTEYQTYRAKVQAITRKQNLQLLENFDKPRGKNGVPGAYQLDHIIPVIYGFENQIDPNVIGDISNLQFIPWEENRKKSFHHSINKQSHIQGE